MGEETSTSMRGEETGRTGSNERDKRRTEKQSEADDAHPAKGLPARVYEEAAKLAAEAALHDEEDGRSALAQQ